MIITQPQDLPSASLQPHVLPTAWAILAAQICSASLCSVQVLQQLTTLSQPCTFRTLILLRTPMASTPSLSRTPFALSFGGPNLHALVRCMQAWWQELKGVSLIICLREHTRVANVLWVYAWVYKTVCMPMHACLHVHACACVHKSACMHTCVRGRMRAPPLHAKYHIQPQCTSSLTWN